MDLVEFMREFAKEIGGQFSEYDNNKSIIVVPLEQGRFQTVIGRRKEESQKRTMLEISSKICRYKQSLNLLELLIENSNLSFAKFAILDDYLKVEATTSLESASPDIVKEMIQEVAEVADQWEQRLAGVDVH
jgi:hypothetical protein